MSGKARTQLQCIAEQGNGTYYDADSASDIESRLTRVATRALRPFTLTGTPIEGGPESAPTPVEVGEYVDTLGTAGESRSYVFTRETAGTTLRVAALSQGEVGFIDGIVAELTGPSGRCDVAAVNRTAIDLREVLGVQVSAGPGVGSSGAEGCEEPGDYVVTITRSRGATQEVPVGLVVTEEPPIEETGSTDPELGALTAAAPQVSGEPRSVDGAASFAGAPEVGTGSWSSTVVPGEVLLYKVPLEFGQAARVAVEFPEAGGVLADRFGRFPPRARLALLNPRGAQLGYVDGSAWLDTADGSTLQAAIPAVSREPSAIRSAEFNAGADVTTAGDYYVAVSVQKKDYTEEIPFRLDVEVLGEPADGPTYAEGASGDEPEVGSGEASGDGSDEAAAESEGDTVSIVAVVTGVLGALALLAALVLWRRRAPRSS